MPSTTPQPWPGPPASARRFTAPPPPGAAQPCRLETHSGLTLQGSLLDFDPGKRRLVFRAASGGPDASLPFVSVRRLTLTVPLQPMARAARTPKGQAPAAAQERDYLLQQVGDANATPLSGRTVGHVETAEGMFLFSPEHDGALCRVFVPRGAYSRCEFGPSAEELATRHWIASPAQLLEALAQQQQCQPLKPLGQSLLALGLLTPLQLDRVSQRIDGKSALGESLVESGLVSRADLQTALAHRMGFPLVDLERFPIDPAAQASLPRTLAISHRVLPLMVHRERLVVAVDRPGRVLKLRQLEAYAQLPIGLALALKSQILIALTRHCGADWNPTARQRAH